MNKNLKQLPAKEAYRSKYNSSRMNLLLVLIMTLVNIVICCCGSDSYFLFSATIPYVLVSWGMLWTGKMPEEAYTDWPESMPFFDSSVFVVMLVIAIIILAVYLLCFLFSTKNRVGWMLTAAIFFGIDTLGLIGIVGFESIIDVLFHGWVLYYLISGTVCGFKLKNLPDDEPVEANGDAIEVPYVEVNTAEAPVVETPTEEAPVEAAPSVEIPAEEAPAEENKES